MENPEIQKTEQAAIKRFGSYEEFLKAFYPESAASILVEEEEQENDFGTNLAVDSLERHADILKFGSS